MAIFKKSIAFQAPIAEQIFNLAHSHMWGINGRMSGFIPTPTPGTGDVGFPGITTVGTSLLFNVRLDYASGDEESTSLANQKSSFSIANGVLLEANDPSGAGIILSITMPSAPFLPPGLPPDDPYTIYAEYDFDPETQPAFKVALQSAINVSPENKAKLAQFNPQSKQWEPTQQVSIRGLVNTILSLAQQRGGLQVAKETDLTVSVGPGSVITSKGRILNKIPRLVNLSDFPATPGSGTNYRQDLLVVIDSGSEAAQPVFRVLLGKVTSANLANVQLVPPMTDPNMVPLAGIIVQTTSAAVKSINSVNDRRPIQNWQTDVVLASDPLFFGSPETINRQPAFIVTSTEAGSSEQWAMAVFTSVDPAQLPESRLVFGKVSGSKSVTFLGPNPAGVFTPPESSSGFPPDPYTVRKYFQVNAETAAPGIYIDVTADPAYGTNGNPPAFDFLNGNFYKSPPNEAMTSTLNNQVFKVDYRTITPVLGFSSDGTRIDRLALDFEAHVAADNPAAHTASNLLYDNVAGRILTLLRAPQPVQAAIDAIASRLFGTASTTGGGTTIATPITLSGTMSGVFNGTGALTKFNLSNSGGITVPVGFKAATFAVDIGLKSEAKTGMTTFVTYNNSATNGGIGAKLHIQLSPALFVLPGVDTFVLDVPMVIPPGLLATDNMLRGGISDSPQLPFSIAADAVIFAWLELPNNGATFAMAANLKEALTYYVNLTVYGTTA